jgi:ABC-type branched-subunit amino acid transport system substrate-binding protein
MKNLNLLLIIFSLSAMILNGCKSKNDEQIKVGIILPLTGNSSTIGQWHKDGIDFFLYSLDSSQSAQLDITYEDSKNEAKEGINAFRKLKTKGIDILFCAMSGVSSPVKGVNENKIPMYVTSVSHPNFLTINDNNVFRYNLTSDAESTLILEEILKRGKSGLNFYYIADEYGVGALQAIEKLIKEKAPTFNLMSQSYSHNTIDFKSIISKNKSDYPIYIAGYGGSYIGILRKVFEVIKPDTLYTVYGMEFDAFVKPLGSADVNVIYTRPRIDDVKSLELFQKKFFKKYNYKPNLVNIFSYDLMSYIFRISLKDTARITKSIYGYELVLDDLGNLQVPLELNIINIKEENFKSNE